MLTRSNEDIVWIRPGCFARAGSSIMSLLVTVVAFYLGQILSLFLTLVLRWGGVAFSLRMLGLPFLVRILISRFFLLFRTLLWAAGKRCLRGAALQVTLEPRCESDQILSGRWEVLKIG